MRFAPNDILIFKLFTFCVYKTDSTKPFMVMLIIHIEKAAAPQVDKAPVILSMSLTKTLICRNFRDMKTKHRVKTMNGEEINLRKIKEVGLIPKQVNHFIGI